MVDLTDTNMDDIDYEMIIQKTREWDGNNFDDLERLWELV